MEDYATYVRVRVLGRGANGSAVLLRSPIAPEKLVVAKEIALACADEANAMQHEVRILQAMSHQHIVAYIGSFVRNDVFSIVMEFADGGTLADSIARSVATGVHLSTALVIRWLSELSAALHHVHARRILHRDLKAENIFLTAEGDGSHVKLGDFGISRALSTQTNRAETVCGTP